MKFFFEYDRAGTLWHGLRLDTEWNYYDLGLLAIDWYGSMKSLSVYLWRFELNITYGDIT